MSSDEVAAAVTGDGTTSAEQQRQAQVSRPEGDGPVTLGDRTEPGGQGSPDTNQAKAEPLGPAPDHPEPLAVPQLSDMNVGAGDPQAPSRPDAGGRMRAGAAGVVAGPQVEPAGVAHKAPGLPGQPPAGESVGTDTEAGAERMAAAAGTGQGGAVTGESAGGGGSAPVGTTAGDPAGVPGTGDESLLGSSEEQAPVDGARLAGGS